MCGSGVLSFWARLGLCSSESDLIACVDACGNLSSIDCISSCFKSNGWVPPLLPAERIAYSATAVVLLLLALLVSCMMSSMLGINMESLKAHQKSRRRHVRKQARIVLSLQKPGSLLLTTLLLASTIVSTAFCIFLSELLGLLFGFLAASFLLLVCVEVIPPTLCASPGQALAMAANTAPAANFLQALFFPLAYPLSKAMDVWVRHREGRGSSGRMGGEGTVEDLENPNLQNTEDESEELWEKHFSCPMICCTLVFHSPLTKRQQQEAESPRKKDVPVAESPRLFPASVTAAKAATSSSSPSPSISLTSTLTQTPTPAFQQQQAEEEAVMADMVGTIPVPSRDHEAYSSDRRVRSGVSEITEEKEEEMVYLGSHSLGSSSSRRKFDRMAGAATAGTVAVLATKEKSEGMAAKDQPSSSSSSPQVPLAAPVGSETSTGRVGRGGVDVASWLGWSQPGEEQMEGEGDAGRAVVKKDKGEELQGDSVIDKEKVEEEEEEGSVIVRDDEEVGEQESSSFTTTDLHLATLDSIYDRRGGRRGSRGSSSWKGGAEEVEATAAAAASSAAPSSLSSSLPVAQVMLTSSSSASPYFQERFNPLFADGQDEEEDGGGGGGEGDRGRHEVVVRADRVRLVRFKDQEEEWRRRSTEEEEEEEEEERTVTAFLYPEEEQEGGSSFAKYRRSQGGYSSLYYEAGEGGEEGEEEIEVEEEDIPVAQYVSWLSPVPEGRESVSPGHSSTTSSSHSRDRTLTQLSTQATSGSEGARRKQQSPALSFVDVTPASSSNEAKAEPEAEGGRGGRRVGGRRWLEGGVGGGTTGREGEEEEGEEAVYVARKSASEGAEEAWMERERDKEFSLSPHTPLPLLPRIPSQGSPSQRRDSGGEGSEWSSPEGSQRRPFSPFAPSAPPSVLPRLPFPPSAHPSATPPRYGLSTSFRASRSLGREEERKEEEEEGRREMEETLGARASARMMSAGMTWQSVRMRQHDASLFAEDEPMDTEEREETVQEEERKGESVKAESRGHHLRSRSLDFLIHGGKKKRREVEASVAEQEEEVEEEMARRSPFLSPIKRISKHVKSRSLGRAAGKQLIGMAEDLDE